MYHSIGYVLCSKHVLLTRSPNASAYKSSVTSISPFRLPSSDGPLRLRDGPKMRSSKKAQS
eukprot:8157670-Pyramimonas_sp.AAC.1